MVLPADAVKQAREARCGPALENTSFGELIPPAI